MRLLTQTCCAAVAVSITACLSGGTTYTPPTPQPTLERSALLNRSRSDVWKAMVPKIAQGFFVINNMDQTSGLVNLSYSGDPEKFVDCGVIVSKVSNARGPREYVIPGSRAQSRYEATGDGKLYTVDRTLSLEGRANIVLEELTPSSTRATVNVRYVLARTIHTKDVMDRLAASSETISFSSGESAAFVGTGVETNCRASGALEQRLLALVNP